mgnify:CR=1 FL=1
MLRCDWCVARQESMGIVEIGVEWACVMEGGSKPVVAEIRGTEQYFI